MLRVWILLMTIMVSCKVERANDLSWTTTLWYAWPPMCRPYWLLFALGSLGAVCATVGVCLARYSAFKEHFTADDCTDLRHRVVIVGIWVIFTLGGFAVSSFSLAYLIATNPGNDIRVYNLGLLGCLLYLAVLLVVTCWLQPRILYVFSRAGAGLWC